MVSVDVMNKTIVGDDVSNDTLTSGTINLLINAGRLLEVAFIRRGRLFKNFISENRYYYKHEAKLHNINKIVIYSVFNKKIKAHIGIFNIGLKTIFFK